MMMSATPQTATLAEDDLPFIHMPINVTITKQPNFQVKVIIVNN
ncbi:hypothetical protein L13192_02248 [Pyrenophora tritici-repentis]|uniref:Uncharacterized protein n=1 Tax=Pyrenophora tritici-repentis TaxID=45151 RepID=A0A922NQ16_9PLEO|nr:hypothetical protein Ptr86124_000484 [Pyrenophora tritici-repentis]KAI1675501.1 hypothetical protein L13192_02248 [Pyrenophora tritici-repentis]KAI1687336.1 hypothetical protein KJE20_00513 [Pyrenophora tritici-repentis]